MSLLGGGDNTSYCQHEQQIQRDEIQFASSTTLFGTSYHKQKPKTSKQRNRKRRKNNTGFYYGIREDVLMPPPPPGKTRISTGQSRGTGGRLAINDSQDKQEVPPAMPSSPRQPMDNNRQPSLQQLDDRSSSTKKKKQKALPPTNKSNNNCQQSNKPQKKSSFSDNSIAPGMTDVLSETLLELREMKEEIIALREELSGVKTKLQRDKLLEGNNAAPSSGGRWGTQPQSLSREDLDSDSTAEDEQPPVEQALPLEDDSELPKEKKDSKRAVRQQELEQIGKDVEIWATDLLFEQEQGENDWKEFSCNKMVKKKFNREGRTQVYLKWMPDSRDEKDIESTSSTQSTYPCLKCYSTIDAPFDTVCSFLSNPEKMPLYNELVVDHADIEEITPHSKITWCKCPKILFVKPRDFVTYCSHAWRKGGVEQVIVNQACEHEDVPGVMVEGQGAVCRGFALRGANFISKDPDDPNKTRITMLSHVNPGGGLPQWAMNTVVNAVVQTEPFKFFHNINDSICSYQEESAAELLQQQHDLHSQTSNVASLPGRSNKPAGMAHLGFQCFWPNGGGLKDSNQFTDHDPQQEQQQDMTLWSNENDEEMEELDDN